MRGILVFIFVNFVLNPNDGFGQSNDNSIFLEYTAEKNSFNKMEFERVIAFDVITPEFSFNFINDSVWIHFYSYEKFLDRDNISKETIELLKISDEKYGYENNPMRSKVKLLGDSTLNIIKRIKIEEFLNMDLKSIFKILKNGNIQILDEQRDNFYTYRIDHIEYYKIEDDKYLLYDFKKDRWIESFCLSQSTYKSEIKKRKEFWLDTLTYYTTTFSKLKLIGKRDNDIFIFVNDDFSDNNLQYPMWFAFHPDYGKIAYRDDEFRIVKKIDNQPASNFIDLNVLK